MARDGSTRNGTLPLFLSLSLDSLTAFNLSASPLLSTMHGVK